MQSLLKNPTVQVVANYFPTWSTIFLAVISFALGMIWAYGIQPVQFYDGSAAQLEQSFQDEWVIGAAGRYAARNSDNTEQVQRLLEEVDDPAGIIGRLRTERAGTSEAELLDTNGFQGIVDAAQPNAANAPSRGSIVGNYVFPLIVLVVYAILLVLGQVLWTLLVYPFLEPIISGRNKSEASEQITAIKERNKKLEDMRQTAVAANQYGEPVIRQLSVYKKGYGNYDDSFNIETDAGLYYGEAGGTISEKVGDDGVTAIEVWMFDKDEFANTPTAIFASDYAYNDPGIRSRLDVKGEVIPLTPGQKAVLETDNLYIEAIARDVDYAPNPTAPNGEIQNSSIEIIAWAKGNSGGPSSPVAPTPMGATPLPQTQPVQPVQPTQPSYAPPPPPGGSGDLGQPLAPPPMGNPGGQPLAPPPMGNPGGAPPAPPNNPPQDDPFGGTGDFTPINPNR